MTRDLAKRLTQVLDAFERRRTGFPLGYEEETSIVEAARAALAALASPSAPAPPAGPVGGSCLCGRFLWSLGAPSFLDKEGTTHTKSDCYATAPPAGEPDPVRDAIDAEIAKAWAQPPMFYGDQPPAPACPECGHGAEHHLPRKNGEHPCCYVLGDRDWCPCTGGTVLAPKGTT